MEKLVSSWFNMQSLPENYIFPLDKRPGKAVVPVGNTIPVINLGRDYERNDVVKKISKASQEFGFFQVINHGVSESLIEETMRVVKEFHAMPMEDKAREGNRDPNKKCKLYTSSENYATEEVHYWRDALTHPCSPLDACIQFWPQKPQTYREVIGKYSMEVKKLCSRILELISEGLGLNPGYFYGELSQYPTFMANHYPPCPEPSLTLGMAKHRDPSLITIVLQENVCGLQVLKDDQWISVEPLPFAFVVNIGYLLQIISNGKLKGAEHRVVTNTEVARTTASLFIYPSGESLIQAANHLVCEGDLPLYRSFHFKDFFTTFRSTSANVKAVNNFLSPVNNGGS